MYFILIIIKQNAIGPTGSRTESPVTTVGCVSTTKKKPSINLIITNP